MEFKRITRTDDPLYARAIALYHDSFPLHEQREALSQSRILENDAYHFNVICDNGAFVGEILYWAIGDFFYIEHFCIDLAVRNLSPRGRRAQVGHHEQAPDAVPERIRRDQRISAQYRYEGRLLMDFEEAYETSKTKARYNNPVRNWIGYAAPLGLVQGAIAIRAV